MIHQKIIYFLCAFSICVYLFSCEGSHAAATYNEGALLYTKHCENCHMDDGTGLEELYPPLAESDMLEALGVGAACVIRNGLQGKILVNGIEFETGMEPVKGLSVVEITNILNFIHNAWGNERAFIQLNEVQATLKECSNNNTN